MSLRLFYRQCGSALCATASGCDWPRLPICSERSAFGAHVRWMGLGPRPWRFNFIAFILLPLAEATADWLLGADFLGRARRGGAWRADRQIGVGQRRLVAALWVCFLIIQPGSGAVPLLGASIALGTGSTHRRLSQCHPSPGGNGARRHDRFLVRGQFAGSAGPADAAFRRAYTTGPTWGVLAGLALAGGLAQLTLTGALRLAPVALVMPMDYTSLLWATLLGTVDIR